MPPLTFNWCFRRGIHVHFNRNYSTRLFKKFFYHKYIYKSGEILVFTERIRKSSFCVSRDFNSVDPHRSRIHPSTLLLLSVRVAQKFQCRRPHYVLEAVNDGTLYLQALPPSEVDWSASFQQLHTTNERNGTFHFLGVQDRSGVAFEEDHQIRHTVKGDQFDAGL